MLNLHLEVSLGLAKRQERIIRVIVWIVILVFVLSRPAVR